MVSWNDLPGVVERYDARARERSSWERVESLGWNRERAERRAKASAAELDLEDEVFDYEQTLRMMARMRERFGEDYYE